MGVLYTYTMYIILYISESLNKYYVLQKSAVKIKLEIIIFLFEKKSSYSTKHYQIELFNVRFRSGSAAAPVN